MAVKKVKIVPMEQFLSTYKQLEQAVRDVYGQGVSVLDYENKLEGDAQAKLSQCRRLRNYAQHNPDGDEFLAVTEAMMTFLNSQIAYVNAQLTTAGKLAKKVRPVGPGSTIQDAFKWLVKNGTSFVPMAYDRTGQYIGSITLPMLLAAMAKNPDGERVVEEFPVSYQAKVTDNVVVISDKDVISKDLAVLLDNDGTILVVRDDNKYVGIINKKCGNWS